VPEHMQLVDAEQTCALMREFVSFYRNLVADYCHLHAPQLSVDLFFSRLVGRVVVAFKQVASGLIQSRHLDASATEGYLLAA